MFGRRHRLLRQASQSAAIPLAAGGAALVALDVARRVFRNMQLFCPSPDPVISWDPVDYGIPRDAVQEVWFEAADGEMLHGWYCRAANPIASGIFCHGNTGNLTVSADVIPHLLDAGLSILFFDYRGFGRSSGRPSIRGVVSDAVTAARFHDTIRPRHLPSVLYGFSLGGAVAAQVARHHYFDGLILQSTFTSLEHIARVTFPRLPMHLFAGGFFDTISVVGRLKIPLLVMHGGDDEVIPCWMAHKLFDACTSPKQIHIVEAGLHKDLYIRDAESLRRFIHEFAMTLQPGDPATFKAEEPTVAEVWTNAALRTMRRLLRDRVGRSRTPGKVARLAPHPVATQDASRRA
jgi:fermentation-respiration switch protein FrsA (DUF1100 family)